MSQPHHSLGKSILLVFLLICLRIGTLHAQKPTSTLISISAKNKSARDILRSIEDSVDVHFSFGGKLPESGPITLNLHNVTIDSLLNRLFPRKDITWKTQPGSNAIMLMARETLPPAILDTLSTFSGTITDPEGRGVAAANVFLDLNHTKNGAQTDINGNFNIRAAGSVIKVYISHLIYNNETISIRASQKAAVTLSRRETELAGVTVTIPYGNLKRKDLTGNVEQIKAKDIEPLIIGNPIQALQGQVSGVAISNMSGIPGSNMNILFRGQGSLRFDSKDNGNAPLYIVDGVPYTSIQIQLSSDAPYPAQKESAYNGISNIYYINPNDITSMEVLKDADVTAIYGSRGANGVVLITTKKPLNSDLHVEANAYQGWGTVARETKVMNTEQYLRMREAAYKNDGTTPAPYDYDVNGIWDKNRNTNWQKKLLGNTAHITDAYTNFSIGSEVIQFLISHGYHKETTVFSNDYNNRRNTFHLFLDITSKDQRFNATASANYGYGRTLLLGQDITKAALTLAPNAPPLLDSLNRLNSANNTFINNPYVYTQRPYEHTYQGIVSNLRMSYELFDGFNIITSLGLMNTSLNELSRKYKASNFVPDPKSAANYGNSNAKSWIAEPQLNYHFMAWQGNFNILLGATFQSEELSQDKKSARDFKSEDHMEDISTGTITAQEHQNSEYRYTAAFARVSYNWKSRYIVNLSGRKDASSRFGQDNRFALFGAVGTAWNFGDEWFVRNHLPFLSMGKLRSSYGTTGSDQIRDYGYLETYTATGPDNLPGTIPSRLANREYKWELYRKFETALELGFFKNMLSLSLAWYRNRSSNQLIGLPLAPTTGFPTVQYNQDVVVQNTGWETLIKLHSRLSPKLEWNAALNLTIPRNKLIAFPNLEGNAEYAGLLAVGEPITIKKLYKQTGIDPTTGLYTFADLNNDHVFDSNDKREIRNIGRRLYGGLQNEFTYKRFKLKFLFVFVKQQGVNYLFYTGPPGTINQNQPAQPDHATIQKYSNSDEAITTFQLYKNSDASITDASYLRLQNFSFEYRLPAKSGKRTLSIFLRGQNVITITPYKGLDPENLSIGLPPLKIYAAGLSFKM
jgi:TonB-dependent starch-binding outer membrane protein SusC